MPLTTDAPTTLDPDRLGEFERYRLEYFYDGFRRHQGTEMLLDVIGRHAVPGDWLDLGAGPCTLFWGLALGDGVRSVTSCDLHPEALEVLDAFARGDEVPPCYAEVAEMLGRPAGHLEGLRRVPRRLEAFDALSAWPEPLRDAQWDLVTVMGLYGLADGPEGYARCFEHLRPHVRPGGRVVGANWLRTPEFAAAEGHDNGYVSTELVESAARAAGFELLELETSEIDADPCFRSVIAWALGAPGGS